MTLKKALVAITVVAMLFGMVSTAFAGGFSDITDTKVAAAATRLNALSIMKGFPDGSFGATQSITRAQFAAVAVRALGLDNAATYAKGLTKFSDVAADHWASGYVNVAAQQGIIAGFPDGTFHPEEAVSYAQALTIITRMLGYGPVTEGKGTWPSNYIVRAAMIGFSNGVTFSATDAAKRGDIALFTDSALTKPMMVETGVVAGQPSYSIDATKTLLGTNLGVSNRVGTLTSSPEVFGAATDKVVVDDGSALTLDDSLALNGAAYAGLIGHSVKVWYNSTGAILLEDKTPAANVVDASLVVGAGPAVTGLTIDGDAATFAATYGIFQNGAVDTTGAIGDLGTTNNETKAILNDNGDVVWVTSNLVKTAVVDSINTGFGKIYFEAGYDGSSLTVNSKMTISGAVSKLADIKAGDVVQWVSDGTYTNAIVTRNAKAGSLTKTTSSKVYVDGTAYSVTSFVDPTAAAVTDLLGEKVTALLDKDGNVVALNAVSSAAAAHTYAVLTVNPITLTTIDGDKTYVKVLKADGTRATVEVDSSVDLTGIVKGSAIDYTVDSDGLIDGVTAFAAAGAVTTDADYHLITFGGSTYGFGATVPVFNITNADATKWAMSTRAALESDTNGVTGSVYASSTGVVKAVVITAGFATAYTANETGVIAGLYRTADGYFFTIISGGTSKDYSVSSTDYTTYGVGDIIDFTVDGTSAKALADTGLNAVAPTGTNVFKVTKVDLTNGLVYVNEFASATDTDPVDPAAQVYYVVNSDTQVFDKSGTTPKGATLNDLAVGMEVDLYTPSATVTSVGSLFVIK